MIHFTNLKILNYLSKKAIFLGIIVLLIGGGFFLWIGISPVVALVSAIFMAFGCYIGGVILFDPKSRLKKPLAQGGFQELYFRINNRKQPETLISNAFDPLSAHEKNQLLVQPIDRNNFNFNPSTNLGLLFLKDSANLLMLKSLFKGLSSEQCLNVISRQSDPAWVLHENIFNNPDALEILFGNMTPEDRLKFLMIEHHSYNGNMSVFLKFILNRRYDTDLSKRTRQINIINFLFKGLSPKQLIPLLAHKCTLSSYLHDPLGGENITALAIAVHTENDMLANLLIQYGALEADPECDFQALLQLPGINTTLFRDKLKATLKTSNYLKVNVIEDLVCDYLIGETTYKYDAELNECLKTCLNDVFPCRPEFINIIHSYVGHCKKPEPVTTPNVIPPKTEERPIPQP